MTYIEDKIVQLKKEKNAVILAHYYQDDAIQKVADFVGDSLELSKKAAEVNASIIVFAGVHFMAETAKILNPNKKVLLPDSNAGCSLADGCSAEDILKLKQVYPNHLVITYINCNAEVKAVSDIVCTSSNALKIVASISNNQGIIFAPDKNLGEYIQRQLNRDLVLWNGSCIVHEAFSLQKLINLKLRHPLAKVIAHPESETHILKIAQFIGSTSQMISYVKQHPEEVYIVATEVGILTKMKELVPNTTLIPAPSKEDNTCACSECAYMKVNTLEKLYNCLKNETPVIELNKALISKARIPIDKMLTF